ncbi:S-formylglutathione hydrolase [Apostasia shenzhenica]|uniref:S-formylglutathione hydrolase n=1 Tax=Apostasia shenzhenica TaxID=1088818 RepID=A0A2I0BGS4_9ASPA|nr:S-formylglutathione hydrolase [Apostasia shenzhenica]
MPTLPRVISARPFTMFGCSPSSLRSDEGGDCEAVAERAMETPEEISSSKMFGGYNRRYKHFSPTLGCSMTFSIYFPPSSPSQKIPVLYWLSGLTCTDENFISKSGAQRAASSEVIALVAPDTSPRGLNIDGEADSWDFGVGAGFYLNATQEKWKNWRMYDYVVKELPKLLSENFKQLDTSKASISGHSMGGHGALTIFFKNTDKYKSVSAFAPIVNPINCPWGQKAFANYLGSNKSDWEEYDATCLIAKSNKILNPILIDQGVDDKFLKEQLLPHNFEEACKKIDAPLVLRMQLGYDHSYYFIATFIDDHIRHHAKSLKSV